MSAAAAAATPSAAAAAAAVATAAAAAAAARNDDEQNQQQQEQEQQPQPIAGLQLAYFVQKICACFALADDAGEDAASVQRFLEVRTPHSTHDTIVCALCLQTAVT
jgi:hypothetical protein